MNKETQIVSVKSIGGLVEYPTINVEEYFSKRTTLSEKLLSHDFLVDTLRKVMGKTLTVIDACMTDEKQNKATKDLIRNIISDELDFSSNMVFDQKELQEIAEEHFKDMTDEELEESSISLDEAIGIEE